MSKKQFFNVIDIFVNNFLKRILQKQIFFVSLKELNVFLYSQ